ncbi:recombinase family protein [Streptomyces bobili]
MTRKSRRGAVAARRVRDERLGRDAAELTALADHLTAHGLVLEMLAGPLPGMYDPSGPGRLLFAFFAAMAETERENIRESTLEGLDAAARKGKHGGRPSVVADFQRAQGWTGSDADGYPGPETWRQLFSCPLSSARGSRPLEPLRLAGAHRCARYARPPM